MTGYKYTNWNFVMFNECTVTHDSAYSRVSGQLTDWRFGRAPSETVHLLQRRGDPSAVTTDVLLKTVSNRLGFAWR